MESANAVTCRKSGARHLELVMPSRGPGQNLTAQSLLQCGPAQGKSVRKRRAARPRVLLDGFSAALRGWMGLSA